MNYNTFPLGGVSWQIRSPPVRLISRLTPDATDSTPLLTPATGRLKLILLLARARFRIARVELETTYIVSKLVIRNLPDSSTPSKACLAVDVFHGMHLAMDTCHGSSHYADAFNERRPLSVSAYARG
eukprot:6188798-Pleurochrysis_carterae.AAC.5